MAVGSTTTSIPGGRRDYPWVFQQLAGPKRRLELRTHARPHGRPRRGTVVDDETETREKETYYPGNSVPTVNNFGVRYAPSRLNGRWSDRKGGRHFAKNQVEEMRRFVEDSQLCEISWGHTYNVIGKVHSFPVKWESDGEVVWELEIRVYQHQGNRPPPTQTLPPPRSLADTIAGLLAEATEYEQKRERLANRPTNMRPLFQDPLGDLVAAIYEPLAQLQAVANTLTSFKAATLSQINRFRASLEVLKRTMRQFRNLFESSAAADALDTADAADRMRFERDQARSARALAKAFSAIAAADAEARRRQRSKIKELVIATPGDTWESIATRVYGDAQRAGELAEVNNSDDRRPDPGETYVAPV